MLCAGYGTRFVRDVEQNPDYAHLQGVPKPLLPIAGKPLISHWTHAIDKYNASSECFDKITDVCTVVNDLFKEKYEEWTKEM